MSIYLYIFIMTIGVLFVVLAAVNACLKSHDKLFNAIEKVKREEQKPPEWSEDDERMRQTAIEACKIIAKKYKLSSDRFYKCKDWLEYRLKLKFPCPQPKQEDRYQEGFQDGVYEGRRKALEEYNKSVAFHYDYADFNHRLPCRDGGPCTNPFFDCINCPRMGNNANTTKHQSSNPIVGNQVEGK